MLCIDDGWQATQCIMRSVFVVSLPPLTDDLTHLGEIAEQLQVEHFFAQTEIEAFDERILIRLAGFDVVDEYAISLAPVHEHLTQKLGVIVGPQHVRQTAFGLEPLEDANQTLCTQRGIDLDGHRFPVEVIVHVEQPEP